MNLQRYLLNFTFYLLNIIPYTCFAATIGTSASIPDVQASQSTSADALQPIVANAQAKRKALTDAEAQPKR